MAGASIEVDDQLVLERLDALIARGQDMAPVYREISEYGYESTRARIEAGGPAPSGDPWAPLAASTIKRKKKNKDKLLIYYGRLLGSIHPQASANEAAWGTNVVYAAAMQFGAQIQIAARSQQAYFHQDKRSGEVGNRFVKKSKSNFAQWTTIGAHTINIPARPFLGISTNDRTEILAILSEYFSVR